MDKEEILHLAELARLNITDDELEAYKKDFEGILGYISSIQEVDVPLQEHYETSVNQNILREDEHPCEAGRFTEDILHEAPDREGDYFKVKKVL